MPEIAIPMLQAPSAGGRTLAGRRARSGLSPRDHRRSSTAKLRAREVSAVELARNLCSAFEAQPRLNAFITITEELALEQARRADDELARGIDRGPLHGIPYALKDNFATRGIPTTCGSKIFADRIPDHDSAVYQKAHRSRRRAHGQDRHARIRLRDHQQQSALRSHPQSARSQRGSPADRAAVRARRSRPDMVFFAMGTDTGGSIRVPAVLLRMRRVQTDLRTREPRRRLSARLLPGSCGSADANGPRCGHRNERDRGTAGTREFVPDPAADWRPGELLQ